MSFWHHRVHLFQLWYDGIFYNISITTPTAVVDYKISGHGPTLVFYNTSNTGGDSRLWKAIQ